MGKRELPRLILISHMIIAKHRKGSTGDVLLNFRGEFTRFLDPTEPAASFFCPLIPPPLELYNIYKRRKMIFFLLFLIHIRFF